ncbi:hypothetical protein [Flavobacterium tructae]|uniref:Uncharacterized protein n=1 Tax=Flavobacterium tructae TaxID=1114873 RepID=A0A1S1J4P4_9FLAO|nr:hypothetical protein [Flavobacterium tructae]OHT44455.1 hypothetical protein BHE19_12105 [Flavobacterium tructae]OXB19409.1 hypothetical protein B0A71_12765 [Flavobacterium tructae]
MGNREILEQLVRIKKEVTDLGLKHIENQMPVVLSDIGKVLKPFTDIDSSINFALKKLSDEFTGSIPKSNSIRS